ncbi:hypothetical protein ACW2AE_05355 [Limosilactobacillus fermentum]
MTNSPTYADHLRRLRSFLGLSADAPLKTVEEALKDYQGDLPQARSPRSRFIATSIRLAHQLPVDDHQAVAQSMKVLGAVKMAHLPGHDDFTHYLGMADSTPCVTLFPSEMMMITQSLPALMAKYSTGPRADCSTQKLCKFFFISGPGKLYPRTKRAKVFQRWLGKLG